MTAADRPRQFRLAAATMAAAFLGLTGTVACAAEGLAPPSDTTTSTPRSYAETFGLRSSFAPPEPTGGPLSIADARAYSAAFDAVKKGRFSLADSIVQAVQDTTLQGRLQYDKLMHSAYHATYGELIAWLDLYKDQPGADRIAALARKREKESPAPVAASLIGGSSAPEADFGKLDTVVTGGTSADPRQQMAREAYYGGDLDTGYRLAAASNERWIAGIASFRLGKFDEAFRWLSDLARDEAQSDWVRSGAAWWAARSAATGAMADQADPYLKLAAATPYTFYGLIAAHQLGLDTATTLAPAADSALPAQPQPFVRAADTQVKVTPAMLELARSDPRARRVAALAQAGAKADASVEVRSALAATTDAEASKTWRAYAASLAVPIASPAEPAKPAHKFDPAQFAAPALTPNGGFTLEKSLVYAIVRQESRFNPSAVSYAGAQGLMQLMPATAHLLGWSPPPPPPRRRHHAVAATRGPTLTSPGENLRLGQAYVAKILDSVQGDLIRAVASYNSGPGTILKTAARLGENVDSLLLIESTPGAQTREYVQKVMSNYWIYRKLWGLPSPTLDAVASGASRIPATMDANKGLGAKVAAAG